MPLAAAVATSPARACRVRSAAWHSGVRAMPAPDAVAVRPGAAQGAARQPILATVAMPSTELEPSESEMQARRTGAERRCPAVALDMHSCGRAGPLTWPWSSLARRPLYKEPVCASGFSGGHGRGPEPTNLNRELAAEGFRPAACGQGIPQTAPWAGPGWRHYDSLPPTERRRPGPGAAPRRA
jgi:hypothetical protein